jgi:polysaccharide biosynthesis protein VpsQ
VIDVQAPQAAHDARARRRWRAAFAAYLVIIFGISASAYLRLIPPGIITLPYFDTGMHFFLLGAASYLSHRALGGRAIALGALHLPLGPLVVAAVAVTDECVQALVPWRNFSALDMIANLAGVLIFGALAELSERTTRASPRA